MRFLAFLISGFWSAGAQAFRGGGVPPLLGYGPVINAPVVITMTKTFIGVTGT